VTGSAEAVGGAESAAGALVGADTGGSRGRGLLWVGEGRGLTLLALGAERAVTFAEGAVVSAGKSVARFPDWLAIHWLSCTARGPTLRRRYRRRNEDAARNEYRGCDHRDASARQ